ncbi:MAG: alpha/beta hydrolase [Gammaproteobacteria bacterium]|nr:alpha/beta hydrolase [Gammaproteobacteria bacterium]MCW8983056.1 alpha/beta hydrolase [Gammaproteobacteria bacterium]
MSTLLPKWSVLVIVWIFLSPSLLAAEVVELKVAPGIFATASYQQGEPEKPAIIMLHGWLQTREFSTIARLYDALSDSGYTLLSPTLSLGISRRAKSLPCESIHTNSLNDDISELEQWVNWLSIRGHKQLILLGHSMGATEVLAFLDQYRGDKIMQSILISIGPIGPGWPDNNANFNDWLRAEKNIATGDKGLSEYGLAYCKKYVTTAENLLSFYRWDYERVHSAIAKLKIPAQIIIGSEDKLLNIELIQQLASEEIAVDTLEGAGHFFDKEFEFELNDAVESYLPGNR